MIDKDSQAARIAHDPAGVFVVGGRLQAKFSQYENDRRLAELKWAKNVRQVLGIYDPELERNLDPMRSKAYPKLTRVKCVSMLSRLMNLLFQDSDKCWAVDASPVPELDTATLNNIFLMLQKKAQQEQRPVTDEEIEEAIRDVAKERAANLSLEIEDQLQELGGERTADFVALCRQVLMSGITYGMGVLKGPFQAEQKRRKWERKEDGTITAVTYTAQRPRFEFVSIWDYYPDMSAKKLNQMDGQFQRIVMSKQQVLALKKEAAFVEAQIDRALAQYPTGNYKRRAYETELKSMGVQLNVTETARNKYEILVWDGLCSGEDLGKCGLIMSDEDCKKDSKACIWMLGDVVIRAEIDAWTVLLGEEAPQMYHQFIFEEDESTLLGNALPNIMRDSQMGVAAAVRMLMDNGSVACGINLEVNTALLSLAQDTTSISAYKVWTRDDESVATAGIPAVRAIDIPSKISELVRIAELFSGFADQETFVGPATGGDMQKGPSEPFRTAAGASMLRGDAALPFKDVVRNFDAFTLSVINALIKFNKQFNKDEKLKGDFQPVARGATSLLAKEVLGIQLDNLASTLTDEEKMYVNMHELVRARAQVRDLDVDKIVVSNEEAQRRQQAQAQQAEAAQTQQTRMVDAQIREILADTLKAISQAAKNNASAEATTANLILDSLEKGISPNALANSTNGEGAASAATQLQTGAGGADVPGAPGAQSTGSEGFATEAPDSGSAGVTGGSESAGFAPIPNQ